MSHPVLSPDVPSENGPRVSEFSELSPDRRASRGSLDALAAELKSLGRSQSPEEMLKMGELVSRRLKLGGADHKASLRRIAAHRDVPFKVTTIWRAVSVYEMSLRMPHLLDSKVLGISHLRAVIGLDPVDQEMLLTLAAKDRWTKRRLEQEAAKLREGLKRRGRRPVPKTLVWAREAERLIARGEELHDGGSFSREVEHDEALAQLTALEGRIRALRAAMEARGTESTLGRRLSA